MARLGLVPGYVVEHRIAGKITKELPFAQDFALRDLPAIAQRALRAYWVADGGRLVERHKGLRSPPDMIVIRTGGGREIFRYSLDDERRAMDCW